MMTPAPRPLAEEVRRYICAGFAGLWVRTWEPDEAERELALLAQDVGYNAFVWDLDRGLRPLDPAAPSLGEAAGKGDPLAPLTLLPQLVALGKNPETRTLLVLHNYHRILKADFLVVQTLFNAILAGKQNGWHLLVLSPLADPPVEIEKAFTLLRHHLPTRDELASVAAGLALENESACADNASVSGEVLQAALGLTRYQAANAFSLSLSQSGALQADQVWGEKVRTLEKQNLLSVYRGTGSFANLGGFAGAKAFCLDSLHARPGRHPDARPRGVLLTGVGGTGKTEFARSLSGETGLPLLRVQSGNLKTSGYGETEGRLQQILETADAMGKCLLFIDEIEKLLAGANRSGDPGVTLALLGILLEWLNDHESEVYFLATSNNLEELPYVLLREERFDAVFFCDLPTREERQAIWNIYLARYGLQEDATVADIDDANWTGAEVKSCCRKAAMLGLSLKDSARRVSTVFGRNAAEIMDLRGKAGGRFLSASTGEVYQQARSNSGSSTGGRRKISATTSGGHRKPTSSEVSREP